MGLALLDVADVIRPHPDVVAFLQQADDEMLPRRAARCLTVAAKRVRPSTRWLARYGMRGVGEIDITRPRWSERPPRSCPLILGNVKNFEAGEARALRAGAARAPRKEADV